MKAVLVNKPIHPEALERLREGANALTPYTASREEVLALLPDAHGLILCAGLDIGAAEMDLAGRMEVIGRHGAGMDNVDVAAASERSIPVVFTPYGPTESTAEHTLMLILATARRLSTLDQAVRTGDFAIRNRPQAMGHEVHVPGRGGFRPHRPAVGRDVQHRSAHVHPCL